VEEDKQKRIKGTWTVEEILKAVEEILKK